MRPLESCFNATTVSDFHHSPWHSPVPYLFGGLALMLLVVAFALTLLACSYWNLSDLLNNRQNRAAGYLEREVESTGKSIKIHQPLDVKVVVIMAGDDKPTYLATPTSNTTSSVGAEKEGKEEETQMLEGENKETQNQI